MRHRSKIVAALMSFVAIAVLAFPAPASALTFGTSSQWRTFPELRQGRYPGSNLVRLWQAIVQADVPTDRTCSQFVDGQFGSNTYTRTRNWQSTFGIGVDGQVGPQTWGTAQLHLRQDHVNVTDLRNSLGTGDRVWSVYYYYDGRLNDLYFSWGWTEHYVNNVISYTTDDIWQFQTCGSSWIYVSW